MEQKFLTNWNDIMEAYQSEETKQLATDSAIAQLDKFIWNIIWRDYRSYAEKYPEELYNTGVWGALEGLKSYNPDKGAPTTYFYSFIRDKLSDFTNGFIHESNKYYGKHLRVINAVIAKFDEQGILYTPQDIAVTTKLPLETVQHCLALRNNMSGHLSYETDEFTSALGSQQISQSAEDAFFESRTREMLEDALEQIDPISAEMIKLTIPGWYNPDEKEKILGFPIKKDKATKKDIAKAFKCSESEVTSRIRRGYTSLKKILCPVRKPDKVLNQSQVVIKPKKINLDDLDIL